MEGNSCEEAASGNVAPATRRKVRRAHGPLPIPDATVQTLASRPERRVSRDIVAALTQLELVSGQTDDILNQFDRRRDSSDGAGLDERDESGGMRRQLVEIQSRLRETKAELAAVTYRAEVLETDRKKLQRQLASSSGANCAQGGGDPGAWEVIAPSAHDDSVMASVDDGDLSPRADEARSVIDRLKQQLDFYASELRAKMEHERAYKASLGRMKERCAASEKRARLAERKCARLEGQVRRLLEQRSNLDRLSSRHQSAWQTLEDLSRSADLLARNESVSRSVIDDLALRCTLAEDQLRQMRAQAQRLSAGRGLDDEQVAAYKEEIAVLQRCLLRKLLPTSESELLSLSDDHS